MLGGFMLGGEQSGHVICLQDNTTGDGMLTAQTIAMEFDAYDMYYEWMLKFQDDQMPDGKLPCIVPACTPNTLHHGNGVDWSSAIVHIPYYTYKYTGNIQIVEHLWDNMVRMMEYFRKCSDTCLQDNGLGDWASYNRDVCPTEITDTVYYRINALMMAEMAEALGKDGAAYSLLAENIKKEFRAKYVQNGAVMDDHITAIICAAYGGMLEEAEIRPELMRALELIRTKENGSLSFGVHGYRMMFDVFTKYGFVQEFFDLVTDTTVPGYGKLVTDGFTTIPENFNYDSRENSRNHQFKAMIDSWLFIYLAGIDPQGFGFDHVVIHPYFVKGISTLSATACGITVSYNPNYIYVESPYPFTLRYQDTEQKLPAGSHQFKR